MDRLQREVGRELPNAGDGDPEAFFHRTENSRALERAEAYYRTMYRGGLEAWNLRERHMAETLEEVIRHLDQRLGRGKVVLWGDNSHMGARAPATSAGVVR